MAGCWISLQFLVCCLILQSGKTTAGYVNVARNKNAYQNSYLPGYENLASRGVDGQTRGTWRVAINTDTNQPYTWWEVDLEKPYFIHEVKIYFKNDFKWRRNGVQVYANTAARQSNTGHLCGTVTGRKDGTDIPEIVNMNCNVNARYVTVYQETDNGYSTALDFVEVEVYACQTGFYGSECDKLCNSRHCQSDSCPADTGSCNGGCQAGWSRVDCTVCQSGTTYGTNCTKLCRDRHCLNYQQSCPTDTGSCNGYCQSGWDGIDCTECDKTYGTNCNYNCNDRHCKDDDSSCDSKTGKCVGGCKPGWLNATCTQKCDEDFYGDGCSFSCSERQCFENQNCSHQTGECVNGCLVGWEGISCISPCSLGRYGRNCNSTCGKCKSGECDSVSGICTQGCSDGYKGVLCQQRSTKDTKSTATSAVTAFSVVTAVLTLLLVISVVFNIRMALIRRKRSSSSEHSVSFVTNNNSHPSTTATPSSLYEVFDEDIKIVTPPNHSDTQTVSSGDAETSYVNTSHQEELNTQEIHDYDKLDIDVVGQGSPYEKIKK